jgi:hypothetical protein
MTFYLSLFLFIISLITGLVLMISWRNLSRERFVLLATMHAILLMGFIASLLLRQEKNSPNYFFMIFICSGVILSGLAWRSQAPKILRTYFSIFILTIPLFLLSPSRLLNFLLSMKFSTTTGPSFDLGSRFFLEKQHAATEKPSYKVIRKRGFFHKTIQRDIQFGGELDSVRVLRFESGMFIHLRGFTSKKSYVSIKIDSTDAEVRLVSRKPGTIEYKL